MTRGVFLDAATVAAARPQQPQCCDSWQVHDLTSAGQVAERIADANIVITNKVCIGAEELAAAPGLRLVVVAATGYDIIDLAAARARGVAVANSPGYSISSLPEHAVALMLAVARSIVPFAQASCDGTWTQAQTFCLHNWPITELRGRTVGLIGSGSLGRATGSLCAALGMKPVYLARPEAAGRRDDLERMAWDDLLAASDLISLHCPLVPDSLHMFGERAFRQMKRSAILINTARGGLVDAHALAAALQEGQIAGAGIDVLEEEPPAAENPLLSCRHPGLVVTPHVAWASRQAQEKLLAQVAATADAFISGRPQHLVE